MKALGSAIPGLAVAFPWLFLVVCGIAAAVDKPGKVSMDMNQ